MLPVTTPPYHSLLHSTVRDNLSKKIIVMSLTGHRTIACCFCVCVVFFGGWGCGEALESTMLAYRKNTLFQTNRIYLPPAFYPPFTLVIFTSRIYVTLNLPFNSSASRNGLEHKKYYCTALIQIAP